MVKGHFNLWTPRRAVQVFSIILKGPVYREDDITKALEESQCTGITVSPAYLSDSQTYRVLISYLDGVRVDLNTIKIKLQQLGFNVVSTSAI